MLGNLMNLVRKADLPERSDNSYLEVLAPTSSDMTATAHDNLEDVLSVTAATIDEPIAGTETNCPSDDTNQETAETSLLQNYQGGNIVTQTEGTSSGNNSQLVSVEDASGQNSVGLAEEIMNVLADTNPALGPEEAIAKMHNCSEEIIKEPDAMFQELDSLEQLAVERVREIEGELINSSKRRCEGLEADEQQSKRMKMVEESIMLTEETHTDSKYMDETSKLIETLSGDLVCSDASLNKECSTQDIFEDISNDEKFGKEMPSLPTPASEVVSVTNTVLNSEHSSLPDTSVEVQNVQSENVSTMDVASEGENLSQEIHDIGENNVNFEPSLKSCAVSSIPLSSEKACEEINEGGSKTLNDNGSSSVTITTELPPSDVSFSSSSNPTDALDNIEPRICDNTDSNEQEKSKNVRSKMGLVKMLSASGHKFPMKETNIKTSEKEKSVLSKKPVIYLPQEKLSLIRSSAPTITLSRAQFLDALKSGLCQIVTQPGSTENKLAVVTSGAIQKTPSIEDKTEKKDQRNCEPKTKERFSSFKEAVKDNIKDNVDKSNQTQSKSLATSDSFQEKPSTEDKTEMKEQISGKPKTKQSFSPTKGSVGTKGNMDKGNQTQSKSVVTSDAFQEESGTEDKTEMKDQRSYKPKTKQRFSSLKEAVCTKTNMDKINVQSKSVVTSDALQKALNTEEKPEKKDQRSPKSKTKQNFSSFKEALFTKDNTDKCNQTQSKSVVTSDAFQEESGTEDKTEMKDQRSYKPKTKQRFSSLKEAVCTKNNMDKINVQSEPVVTSDAFQNALNTKEKPEKKDQRSPKSKTKQSFSPLRGAVSTKDNMDKDDQRPSKSNTKQSSSFSEGKLQHTAQNTRQQSTPTQKYVVPSTSQIKSSLKNTYRQQVVSKSCIENCCVPTEKSRPKKSLNKSQTIDEEAEKEYALIVPNVDLSVCTDIIEQSSRDNTSSHKTYEKKQAAKTATSPENHMQSDTVRRNVSSPTVHPDEKTLATTLQHLHKKITYDDLKTCANSIKLPSTLWSFQVEPNGNYVTFLRVRVGVNNITVDKAVMFEKSLEPQVFMSGNPVALPIFPISDISDITDIINCIDKVAFCQGTGVTQRPNSKNCHGYLDVSNPGNRCSHCLEERRRVLFSHQEKLKERLKQMDEGNSDAELDDKDGAILTETDI